MAVESAEPDTSLYGGGRKGIKQLVYNVVELMTFYSMITGEYYCYGN